jgi:phosphoribosylformimino-5-aminoimidazole carboxamide ribotide isomerase
VVDLDGARDGQPVNIDHLRRIARELAVPVQYGGGLRTLADIALALDAGAERVILGTAAFADPQLLRDALDVHGAECVLVSIDARDGRVATHGWLQTTHTPAPQALRALHDAGVAGFVYTDIDSDGTLGGADLQGAVELLQAAGGASVIYSGGIGALEDLERLARLRRERGLDALAGVIVGKALYERRFTVAEAHAALAA